MKAHPDELLQPPVLPPSPQTESDLLENALNRVTQIDLGKVRQEIYMAQNNQREMIDEGIDDHEADEIIMRLKALRARLSCLLNSIDLIISMHTPVTTYRSMPDVMPTASRLVYNDLVRVLGGLLKSDYSTIDLWRRLRVNDLKWYQNRLFNVRYSLEVDGALDLWVQIMEMLYRKTPAYGQDFHINRDRLQFTGDLNSLVTAASNKWVRGAFVEAYPNEVISPDDLRMGNHEWLLKQFGTVPGLTAEERREGNLMKDIVGKAPKISFLCFVPKASPYYDIETQRPSDQLKSTLLSESHIANLFVQCEFDAGFFKRKIVEDNGQSFYVVI